MSARPALPTTQPTAVRRRRRTSWSALVGALLAVLVSTLLVVPQAAAANVSAQTLLDQLGVGTESGASSYDRDAFRHWVDANGNGCDTRAEVLIEESTVTAGRSGTCTITSGRWVSDYDGAVLTAPGGLDIDHMVPLKEAWISGASSWSAARKEAFANDLGYAPSLVAVSASSNRSKSDQDPDSWLPARATCDYVKRWVAVKWRWGLRIDSAERAAVQTQLDGCSSLTVPAPSRA